MGRGGSGRNKKNHRRRQKKKKKNSQRTDKQRHLQRRGAGKTIGPPGDVSTYQDHRHQNSRRISRPHSMAPWLGASGLRSAVARRGHNDERGNVKNSDRNQLFLVLSPLACYTGLQRSSEICLDLDILTPYILMYLSVFSIQGHNRN